MHCTEIALADIRTSIGLVIAWMREVFVKRPLTSLAAVCVLLLLALPSCRRNEQATGDQAHETIAPATPQPAPTGTDAMTQTVDIEQGRSEAEGGGLTSPQTTETNLSGATTTTTTTATAPGAPATTTTQ